MTIPRTYKVDKPDHIWTIVRDLLPDDASTSEIWAAIREIHEANPQVGPKQLTVRGQVIEVPDSVRERYAAASR